MNRARILIAEDELLVAEDMRHALVTNGFDVPAIAESADQAVDYARKYRPDLVLMDIEFPDDKTSDGIEAAKKIRAEVGSPIVYVTVHSDPAIIERAKRTNPAGFVLKPFQHSQLRAAVEIALHQAQNEIGQQIRAKLESSAEIAAGVAHNFNNLLTVMLLELEHIAKEDLSSDERLCRLRNIEETSQRMTTIIKKLKQASTEAVFNPAPLDVNVLVREVTEVLTSATYPEISIETQLAKDIWQIMGDRHQVFEAIVHLLKNAVEAIPISGRLIIRTANLTAHESILVHGGVLPPGKYVNVAITDTGTGMTGDTIRKIFDPFFSTREQSLLVQGVGFGLPITWNIMNRHSGGMRVQSSAGKGTCVELFFPIDPSYVVH